MSGSATERSESSEAWSEERVRQLEEDKAAIERLWGEHAQENDIGVLKFKLVSLLAVLRTILRLINGVFYNVLGPDMLSVVLPNHP